MGREIKRVPVDFDWPLNEIWKGYINPFSQYRHDCEACGGIGYSPDAKRLYDQWYGNAPFSPTETGSTILTVDTPAVRAFAERNVQRSPGVYGVGESAIRHEAMRLCRATHERL